MNSTGSSISVESHEPSMTIVPFMVPSFGRMNTLPAGRFVNIRGRLQIPLSSSFQSRQLTSNVTSVPDSDLTLMIRRRRRKFAMLEILRFTSWKSDVMPPSVYNSKVIPGIVATRAPSFSACRTALVCVSEYFVAAITTCCWRINAATGEGGSSP